MLYSYASPTLSQEPLVVGTRVRDLSKEYRRKLVLDRVNLHVVSGSVYALVGRNGAGKDHHDQDTGEPSQGHLRRLRGPGVRFTPARTEAPSR